MLQEVSALLRLKRVDMWKDFEQERVIQRDENKYVLKLGKNTQLHTTKDTKKRFNSFHCVKKTQRLLNNSLSVIFVTDTGA